MSDSRSFSHNQSLCHELVPGVFRPHFLENKRERPMRNGDHCRPRARLLKPVICLFFAGHEFKLDCRSSCHELAHDGYRGRYLRPRRRASMPCGLCVAVEVWRLSGVAILKARTNILLLTAKKWRLQSGCNHSTAYVNQWKG